MSRTILVIVTSHDRLDSHKRTGVWLEEFVVPFEMFRAAGATVTVASPAGGDVPIEPRSLALLDTRAHADAIAALLDTRRLADVDASAYDAVFLPGGHGPMFDLASDPVVARSLAASAQAGRVLAAVCHGPAALVEVTDASGAPLVRGRRVTAFSDAEEAQTGLEALMPFSLESRLTARGARFEHADPWEARVVVDDRLITGQNPASSKGVASAVLSALA